jgi:hypothetical protein
VNRRPDIDRTSTGHAASTGHIRDVDTCPPDIDRTLPGHPPAIRRRRRQSLAAAAPTERNRTAGRLLRRRPRAHAVDAPASHKLIEARRRLAALERRLDMIDLDGGA